MKNMIYDWISCILSHRCVKFELDKDIVNKAIEEYLNLDYRNQMIRIGKFIIFPRFELVQYRDGYVAIECVNFDVINKYKKYITRIEFCRDGRVVINSSDINMPLKVIEDILQTLINKENMSPQSRSR